jgi:hypothetical protein
MNDTIGQICKRTGKSNFPVVKAFKPQLIRQGRNFFENINEIIKSMPVGPNFLDSVELCKKMDNEMSLAGIDPTSKLRV